MTAPNMAAITAALERSLQNCSLNHHNNHNRRRGFLTGERSSSSEDRVPLMEEEGQNHNFQISSSSDTTLELNSHMSLPYDWEQCLDLKTGEIYYINWRNGMKAKEDPRITAAAIATTSTEDEEYNINDELYSEEEEDEEESSYESEESSSEYSSPPSSSRQQQNYRQQMKNKKEEQVLVVAGCKGCLMYFMVPKQVEDCPKCNGQLLHFDRSDNASP